MFFSTGISPNSAIAFSRLTSNLVLIEDLQSTSFQSCQPTWKSFLSLADTLFHLSSTCSKEIFYKKVHDSCHGLSCSWTSFNGIQHFFKCCISLRSHTRFEWDVICTIHLCKALFVTLWLTRLGWVQRRVGITQDVCGPCLRVPSWFFGDLKWLLIRFCGSMVAEYSSSFLVASCCCVLGGRGTTDCCCWRARMNLDILDHVVWILQIFWSDSSVQLMIVVQLMEMEMRDQHLRNPHLKFTSDSGVTIDWICGSCGTGTWGYTRSRDLDLCLLPLSLWWWSTSSSKPLSSKKHFHQNPHSSNHFHQKPISSKTNFIKNQFHQKPVSSQTSFITNQFHHKPLSSKTSFIKNHFHQKPISSETIFITNHLLSEQKQYTVFVWRRERPRSLHTNTAYAHLWGLSRLSVEHEAGNVQQKGLLRVQRFYGSGFTVGFRLRV